MKKQILILENLGIPKADAEARLKNPDYDLVWDETQANPDNVEILITITKKVSRESLEAYPNLKMIAVAFTGFDAVDSEACREKNIAVYNVPGYATDSVAELAAGLAISLLREIPKANRMVKDKDWGLKPGFDLKGKTVGIVGTGAIGIATAKLFKAFGCKLIAWSRSEKPDFINLGGSYCSGLRELFSQADLISLHLPLNNQTRGIIDYEVMAAMKPGAFLINTARGPVIDEPALIKILKEEKIAGAALDVFDKEPPEPDNELLQLNNVILTPHIAYNTKEALQRRAVITAKNISDFNKGKKENRVI